ncbi:MAG: phosphatase PAP2 family protein [Candidatus Paceibacterota bacterium]
MAITNKVKVLIVIALMIVFLAIAIAVANGKTAAFDLEWSKTIYSLRTPILTQIMFAASAVSSTPFTGLLTALVIGAFWIKKRHKTAIFFGAALLASVIANNAIKYSVHRFRPDIAPLEDASFYSFPSGHSMNSLVFYGILLYIAHKSIKNKHLLTAMDIAAILFVALVGFCRVYLGAHYPTDVIAGFCAGGAILFAAIMIANRRGDSM